MLACDNTPYEKIGNNEPVNIADEVPFKIPDSWEWTRFGQVIVLLSGTDFRPDEYNDKMKGIPYITGASSLSLDGVIVNRWTESPRVIANRGDVLLVCKGSGYGKTVICDIEEAHIARQIMAIKEQSLLDMQYVRLFLQANCDQIKAKGQGVIPGIDRDSVMNLLFPLPPLNEQHKIANRIAEVENLLSSYDLMEHKLSSLQNSFPEQLKKSILQMAVQGKLVPQNPTDEPASMLLERIRAEKHRLIKEGKIKKDKHESVIFRRDNSHYEKRGSDEVCIDSELPFDIPDNWSWSRLYSFGIFSSGKTPSMQNPDNWNGKIPWVSSKDMKKPVIMDSEMHITELAAESMQLYPGGTLLLVARSGILRRLLPLCVLGVSSTINQDIKAFSLYDISLSQWLYYAIKAFEPYILKELVKSVTTVESLKFDEFMSMLIPVPPEEEQIRIICALKEALSLLAPLSSDPLFSL